MSTGRGRSARFGVGLAVIGLSLALFFVLAVIGLDPDPEHSLGPDTYSVSGLGHSGVLTLLQERGVTVTVSRWDSATRAGQDAALVIAEPDASLERRSGRRRVEDMVEQARRVLLVAPKRMPLGPAPERPTWMSGQELISLEDAQRPLSDWDLELQRVEHDFVGVVWRTPADWPEPTLANPPQLLAPYEALRPIVSCPEGILLGRLEMPTSDHTVLVLSDPDVLANHGLVEGENAAFALALLDLLRGESTSLVWDETWHGHVAPAQVGRLLMRPPLGYIVASLALLALLALWSGAVRFGGARPMPAPLRPGKAFLVGNTADLLRAGGHAEHVLRRYLEAAERETAERLHAPRAEPGAARKAVEALAHARHLPGPAALREEVERALEAAHADPRALVAAGERIHRWKEELTHGRRRGS